MFATAPTPLSCLKGGLGKQKESEAGKVHIATSGKEKVGRLMLKYGHISFRYHLIWVWCK